MRIHVLTLFIWASFCQAQSVDPELGSVLISSQAIFNTPFNFNSVTAPPELDVQKAELLKWLKAKAASDEVIRLVSNCKETLYYPSAIKKILGPGNFDLITITCPYSDDHTRIYLARRGRLIFRVNNRSWLSEKVKIPIDLKSKFNKEIAGVFSVRYSEPDLTQVSFDMAEGDYPGGIFMRYPVFNEDKNEHVGWLGLTYLVNVKMPIDIYFTSLAKR